MERALTEALARWRQCRCERLALNIDLTIDHLARARPQFAAERFFEVAARRRDEDLPGLLSVLPEPGAPELPAHLDALRGRPPHPTLAEALRRLLEARADLAAPRWRWLWRRALVMLAESGDPRVRTWLPSLVRAQRGGTPAARAWLEAECGLLCGGLPRAAPTDVDPLGAVGDVSPLVPLSDDARLVFADGLSEQGDPLGEFVTLQYRPALAPVERRRAEELQRRHARRWLGPLSRAVRPDGLRFERGVVVACRLSGDRAAELTNHPAWATVRSLDLRANGLSSNERLLAFLRAPVLRGLAELRGVPLELAYMLVTEPVAFRLEALELAGYGSVDLEILSWGRVFGALREVKMNGQRWLRAPGQPWAADIAAARPVIR